MATKREQRLARAIENMSCRGFEDFVNGIAGNDAGFSTSGRAILRRNLLQFAQENYYGQTNQVADE